MTGILSLLYAGVPGTAPEIIAAAEAGVSLIEAVETVVVVGSAFTLNSVSAAAAGLFMQCDSPRVCGEPAPQAKPLPGLSRFAPVATADGATSLPHASGAPAPLPQMATPDVAPADSKAVAARQLLNDLRALLEGPTVLDVFQREFLRNLIELAMVGTATVATVFEKLEQFLTQDLVRKAKAIGVSVEDVPEGTRFTYDSENPRQKELMGPLFAVMAAIERHLLLEHMTRQMRVLPRNMLTKEDASTRVVLLPKWQSFWRRYPALLARLHLVAHPLTQNEVYELRKRGTPPVEWTLMNRMLADVESLVHPLVHLWHDVAHAFRDRVLARSAREMSLTLFELLRESARKFGTELDFEKVLGEVLDADIDGVHTYMAPILVLLREVQQLLERSQPLHPQNFLKIARTFSDFITQVQARTWRPHLDMRPFLGALDILRNRFTAPVVQR